MNHLEQLERAARKLADVIKAVIPKWAGFTLLIFEYGDGGSLTYISSAERSAMVETLRECADKIEGGTNKHPSTLS